MAVAGSEGAAVPSARHKFPPVEFWKGPTLHEFERALQGLLVKDDDPTAAVSEEQRQSIISEKSAARTGKSRLKVPDSKVH